MGQVVITESAVSSPERALSEQSLLYDVGEIDLDSDGVHAQVVRLVGEGKHVLELGCSTGYMSRALRERGCRVVGVELDLAAARRAAEFCERVIAGDIDRAETLDELDGATFDVVVAADVLEHLKDPAGLLRRVKDQLHPEGHVVASLPNVAHGSVRLALLEGRFRYGPTGLLDRTHLRFFTRQSALELFEQAGYAIGHHTQMDKPLEFSEVSFRRDVVPRHVWRSLANDPDALAYQFIIVGYPLPA